MPDLAKALRADCAPGPGVLVLKGERKVIRVRHFGDEDGKFGRLSQHEFDFKYKLANHVGKQNFV